MKNLFFYLPLFLLFSGCNQEKLDLEKSKQSTEKSQLKAVYWGIEEDGCHIVHSLQIEPGLLRFEAREIQPSLCVFVRNPNHSCEKISDYYPWGDVLEVIDLQAFMNLPEQIECNTCEDNILEWIEVKMENSSKKVKFNRGQIIPSIRTLQEKIIQLKDSFVAGECIHP
jgi:hypothetical protein